MYPHGLPCPLPQSNLTSLPSPPPPASTVWVSVLCSINITSNLPTASAIASMTATLFVVLVSVRFIHSFPFCLFSIILILIWKCVACLGIARCSSQATASGVLPAWIHRSPLPSSCPKETPFLITTRPVIILDAENEPQDNRGLYLLLNDLLFLVES